MMHRIQRYIGIGILPAWILFATYQLMFTFVSDIRMMSEYADARLYQTMMKGNQSRNDRLAGRPSNATRRPEKERSFTETLLRAFHQRLNDNETASLMDILRAFDDVTTRGNVTYILYGGSLLGSYRHHGIIPWDDDVDVMVSKRDAGRLHSLLLALPSSYSLDCSTIRWKLFLSSGARISHHSWKFPFIDINFYESNRTHLWDIDPGYAKFVFPKKHLFPTSKRPFGRMYLPTPRYTNKILKVNYNTSACKSSSFSHRTESFDKDRGNSDKIISCRKLHRHAPFVHRTRMAAGVNETLQLDGNTLRWWLDSV